MKTSIFALFLCFFFIEALTAQSSLPKAQADSLWAIWDDPGQPDTARLNAIYDFIWDGYLFSQPDSAFYYAQLQYKFARSKGLKMQMAKALNAQGVSWATRGDYSKALECYLSSLKNLEEVGDKGKLIAPVLNNIGLIYKVQGNYPEALEYFQRSLQLPQLKGDKKGSAAALSNIGMIYKIQGDLPAALDYFLRGLKLNEEIGNKRLFGVSLINVGGSYYTQGDYPRALDYLQQGLTVFQEIGDKNRIAMILNSIGAVYENQGDLSLALEYRQRSLSVREEIGDKEGMGHSLMGIGHIHALNGDNSLALEYYERSLGIRNEIGDLNGATGSLRNIGDLYNLQNDHEGAIDWCEKGLRLADEIGAIEEQKLACECLYTAYKAMGVNDEALGYYEQMIGYRDSLFNEENTKKLARIEMQYELDKKAAALKAEQKRMEEIKTRRNNLQYSISFIVVLMIFGVVLSLGYVRVSRRIAEALILFSLLIFFEFCLVFMDPYKSQFTGNQPAYTLLFNAMIALLVLPVHAFFENRLKKRIIKNKS